MFCLYYFMSNIVHLSNFNTNIFLADVFTERFEGQLNANVEGAM